jgi:regulator of sigma E protease
MITALYVLAVFTLLVAVHELGHMIAAKLCRMRVEEFAFGMGPLLKRLGRGRDGTEYTWRWLPIGGFVKIPGMLPGEEDIVGGFQSKSRSARFITILAGPVASILLGFVLFFLVGVTAGLPMEKEANPLVQFVDQNTPAQRAGVRIGDMILSVDGQSVLSTEDARKVIEKSAGKNLQLRIRRDGSEITLNVVPEPKKVKGEDGKEQTVGRIGVMWQARRERVGVLKAVTHSFEQTWFLMTGITGALGRIISEGNVKELGGPISIVNATGAVSRLGLAEVAQFAGSFSIMLGIFNLLPIPVLDGGYLLLIAIEAIRRKKMSPQAAMAVQFVGLAIVLVIFVSVISLDLYRLATGQMIR